VLSILKDTRCDATTSVKRAGPAVRCNARWGEVREKQFVKEMRENLHCC